MFSCVQFGEPEWKINSSYIHRGISTPHIFVGYNLKALSNAGYYLLSIRQQRALKQYLILFYENLGKTERCQNIEFNCRCGPERCTKLFQDVLQTPEFYE